MPAGRSVCLRVNAFILSVLIITTSEAAPNSVTIGVILPERVGGGAEAVLQQSVTWLNEFGRQLPGTRLVLDYLSPSQPGLRQQVCQFLRGPVVALLSLDNSCSTIQQLQRLAQELSVPFFVINRFYCLKASANGNGVFLSKADHLDMLSLVTQWVSATGKLGVTVLSTDEQPADRAYLLSSRLSHLSHELVRPGRGPGAVRRRLLQLLDTPRPDADFLPAIWAFVLLAEPTRLADILREVDEAGLLTAASPWLLAVDGWTAGSTPLALPTDANVTLAHRQLSGQLTAQLRLIARHVSRQTFDAEQTFVVSALLAVAESLQAGWEAGWLPQTVSAVTENCQPQPDWAAAAPTLSRSVQDRLTRWGACLTCLAFELDASKYGRHVTVENGTGMGLLPAGYWNATWRLDLTFPDLFLDSHLIVCALPWHGMMAYDIDTSGALVNLSGLSVTILDTISKELGFTYSVVEPPDGEWGVLRPDGSWTGLVRMLMDRKADVCGAFALTPARQSVIDNTQAFYTDYYDLLAPKVTLDLGLFIYKDPFEAEVWLGILVTMVGTSVLLYLITRASPHYEHEPGTSRRQGLFRLTNCLWYMYGATINQGGEHLPSALSGRLLVGFYWLFTLICVATYSGNLIATLTVPSVSPIVRDVQDLITSTETGWLTAAGTDFEQMVMNPVAGVSRGLERMYREGRGRFYTSSENVLPMVKAGGWVDIASALDIRFQVDEEMRKVLARDPNSREPCELDIVPLHVMEINVVFGLQKRSPYKPAFDRYLRMMQETGLIQAWLRHSTPNASLCLPEDGLPVRHMKAGQTGLSLAEMQGAFLLLLAGLVVSAAALLLERLVRGLAAVCRRYRRRRRRLDSAASDPEPAAAVGVGAERKVAFVSLQYPSRELKPTPRYGPHLEPTLDSIQQLACGLARLKAAHHGVAPSDGPDGGGVVGGLDEEPETRPHTGGRRRFSDL